MHEWPLGSEPRMGEALGCCCPPFRHQVQHGQKEAAERVGLLFGPLVLLYQHLKQTPRFQLGDVTQVACEKVVNFIIYNAERIMLIHIKEGKMLVNKYAEVFCME